MSGRSHPKSTSAACSFVVLRCGGSTNTSSTGKGRQCGRGQGAVVLDAGVMGRAYRNRMLWVASVSLLALARCVGSRGPARVVNVEPTVALSERHLESGLQLLVDAARTSPLAGATFVVNAGGAADPPGKEGLAHLVEHLVFRSRHGDKPRVDSRLNAIVADWNGGTAHDWVYYSLFAPNAEFDEALALTFEMMVDPIAGISQVEFEHERSIVKAERGFRSEHFVGAVEQLLNEALFAPGSAAARSVGGTQQSLETLTLADVESFADRYYRPERMTLYVALPPGRSETDLMQALPPALSGAEFQRTRQRQAPSAPKSALRAPGTIERRYASVPHPQLFFGWPLAGRSLLERARAELMSDFLDVRVRPSFYSHPDIADGACGVRSLLEVSLLWCRLDLDTAEHAPQVAARWLSDVRQTFTGNSTAWSWWLQQRFVLGRVLAAEQVQRRAFERAVAAFEYGSHTAYDQLLAQAEDVQMSELFAMGYEQMQLEQSTMLLVLPHADQAPGPPVRTGLATPSEESTSDSATDAVAALEQLPAGALGQASTRRLDNGLEIIVLPRAGQYSTALLGFRGGTAWAENAAVARAAVEAETWNITPDPITWGVMLERHRVEEATFEVARVTGDRLDKAFEVLGSARTVTVEWPNNQFRRRAGALQQLDAAPARVSQRKTREALLDHHPFAAFAPVPALEQVRVQSVRHYLTSLRRPDNAVLVVVGPADTDSVVGLAKKEFGSWQPGTTSLSAPPPATQRASGGERPLVAVHRSAATQVDIAYSCLVPVNSSDDQARMDLLQSMLEEELWGNLREQSGVAYGAWVEAYSMLEGGGLLQLATRVAAEHLSHALRVFESLGAEGTLAFNEKVFEQTRYREVRAQAFVDGSTRASAARLYDGWLLGLSPRQQDEYPNQLARTSLAAVRDALEHCRRHAVLTLLGDARVINATVGRKVASP